MLNISGPPPVPPAQRPEDSALILRLNQRIAAEVLQVSGDNVVLAIDGTRVVAKLTTADQAAALQERRVAQFIVKDINTTQILIQLAPSANPAVTAQVASQDLARALLSQMGLPVERIQPDAGAHHGGARPAGGYFQFERHPGCPQPSGRVGQPAEAQAAAALKAAGLPLTPATLSLVLNAPQEVSQAYSRLLSLLQGLPTRQLAPRLRKPCRRPWQRCTRLRPNGRGILPKWRKASGRR